MKSLASVLERIGAKSYLNNQVPRRSKTLLRSLGVNPKIACALVGKKSSVLKHLVKDNVVKSCFIMTPPTVNLEQLPKINLVYSKRLKA